MAPTPEFEPIRFNPVAGLLAFVLPGAGHVFLGQRLRGVLMGAGILALFFGGMLLGGISIVDSKSERLENRISFYGQAMVGPVAIAVDRVHQSMFKGVDPGTGGVGGGGGRVRSVDPGETLVGPGDPRNGRGVTLILPADPAKGEGPPYVRSQGKVHEIGLLYTVLAGMLNFIVIIDALFPGGMAKGTPRRGLSLAAEAGLHVAVASATDAAGRVVP